MSYCLVSISATEATEISRHLLTTRNTPLRSTHALTDITTHTSCKRLETEDMWCYLMRMCKWDESGIWKPTFNFCEEDRDQFTTVDVSEGNLCVFAYDIIPIIVVDAISMASFDRRNQNHQPPSQQTELPRRSKFNGPSVCSCCADRVDLDLCSCDCHKPR